MTSQIWQTMGWLEIQKLEYLENGAYFFYEIKFLTSASDDKFFVAEVSCHITNIETMQINFLPFIINHFYKDVQF